MNRAKLQMGSDLLEGEEQRVKSWGKVILLSNHASTNRKRELSPMVCHTFLEKNLVGLLGPQHGFWGTEQDNMLETEDSIFPPLGIPLYSLYHRKREPDEEMLRGADSLLVDLQITGCRVYTFKWTILNCLKACQKLGKKMVVLDRPNPLGGFVTEGRILEKEAESFVGLSPIPMRHALSVGEFAQFVNGKIGAELEVIKMKNYDPHLYWDDYDSFWPFTSPNLPSFDSVLFYPGFVLFEGTNISEGRGTTLPFQMIGAPFVKNPSKLIKRVKDYLPKEEGYHLKEAFFKPTFNKWAGEVCGGAQLILEDKTKLRSYELALCFLKSFMDLYEKEFDWKKPPYEYEYKNLPINLILGSNQIEDSLKKGTPFDSFWKFGLKGYQEKAQEIFLYERNFEL